MVVPPALWNILEVNNTLENIPNINIKTTNVPAKTDDGDFSINLTMTQWQQFQDNIKKPATVPIEEPKPAPEPAPEPEPEERPVEKPDGEAQNEISVTQKPSRLNV